MYARFVGATVPVGSSIGPVNVAVSMIWHATHRDVHPEPAGYGDTKPRTAGAFYDKNLGQFILPYDAVRQARDPDTLLLGFLQETYAAAADLARWDRKALERA